MCQFMMGRLANLSELSGLGNSAVVLEQALSACSKPIYAPLG